MIHKIQSTLYHIRSHGQTSVVSSGVLMLAIGWLKQPPKNKGFDRARIKKMIWHLQDVLKCMTHLQKQNAAKESLIIEKESTPGQEANK